MLWEGDHVNVSDDGIIFKRLPFVNWHADEGELRVAQPPHRNCPPAPLVLTYRFIYPLGCFVLD